MNLKTNKNNMKIVVYLLIVSWKSVFVFERVINNKFKKQF